MKKIIQGAALLLILNSYLQLSIAHAQGTAFTYQGRLNSGGSPANGSYDLVFTLFSTNVAGAASAGPVTNAAVAVTNGLFTTLVNFGPGVFTGTSNWLELAVSTNGVNNFSTLAPRQQVTPTPYAITAANAGTATAVSGNIPVGQVTGVIPLTQLPVSVVTNGSSGVNLAGSFTGNGANVTNVNAVTLNGSSSAGFWKTNGNTGANPTNGVYFGTADNLPVEFKVNGQRALRMEPNVASPNILGGSPYNQVSNGVVGAFIGGGGNSVSSNRVSGNYGSVLGGAGNTASGQYSTAMGATSLASADYATAIGGANTASGISSVAMGFNNTATNFAATAMGFQSKAFGFAATAMGGSTTASGDYSTVMGNNNIASGNGSFAMGFNNAATTGSTTALGYGNTSSGGSSTATGYSNTASGFATIAMGATTTASGDYAVAMGSNSVASGLGSTAMGAGTSASGTNSTAMGYFSIAVGNNSTAMGNGADAYGDTSTAMGYNSFAKGYVSTAMGYDSQATGDYSLAMGVNAQAQHKGSFVWADSQGVQFIPGFTFSDTGNDQFCIRAQGGVILDDTTPAISFGSTTRQMLNLYNANYGVGVQNSTLYQRSSSRFSWFKGGVHSDTGNDPGTGGSVLMTLTTSGLTVNGTLASTSDRNAKEDFAPVNSQEVLARVAAMPITKWVYKTDTDTKHIGPMAQDFYAAFAVGPDDKHITTVDEGGVALAAIQGLNQKVEAKDAKLQQQSAEIAELKARLEKLERLLTK